MTEFYDRIENRLFNVRHCRNIEGVFRDLPLYEPEIDPLLLIRARAAGLNIADVLDNLDAPLPNYRFSFTLQKALELCAELKALGGALLAALEKMESEELTLLRSGHEITLLKLVSDIRKQQIGEAEANIAALQQSEVTILERFSQYQKLLGKPSITKGQDGLPVVEQSSSLAVSTDTGGGVSGLGLIRREVEQISLTAVAHGITQKANHAHVIAGVLSMIPNFYAGAPFGIGGQTFGGSNLGSAASTIAKSVEMIATELSYLANQAGVFGGYERRQDEWVHQSKLALAEMKQIQKQILAAEIRKSMAKHELENHDTQIENANKVDEFLHTKFTSQQLYSWMVGQISNVYFRTYQLALDQARRAERAYQHELGLDSQVTPFVQAGNWDTLKSGLLAGEHLHHDLKRMESAYLERNVREFEITKHISLLQLDPGALIALKETGTCSFHVPEMLFDLDYPGHYVRRIKMLSISIPCVVGSYASVSATLNLTKNEIRVKAMPTTPYNRQEGTEGDARFKETVASISAIVTSNAQQDSGMFEPNLRDERYLPFEGAGTTSWWTLKLPDTFRSFDYNTISDVVVHMKYTARDGARDGGQDLREKAVASVKERLKELQKFQMRLFSLRHEFPTEWHRLQTVQDANGSHSQAFSFAKHRFPFLFQGGTITVKQVDLFGISKDRTEGSVPADLAVTLHTPAGETLILKNGAALGLLVYKTSVRVAHQEPDVAKTEVTPLAVEVSDLSHSPNAADWSISVNQTDVASSLGRLEDILVLCHYSVEMPQNP